MIRNKNGHDNARAVKDYCKAQLTPQLILTLQECNLLFLSASCLQWNIGSPMCPLQLLTAMFAVKNNSTNPAINHNPIKS